MGALIVFGYGPGISHATAERFGREGYSLALVGRSAERLAEGASRLNPLAHWLSYSSWRRHQWPVSLRPSGARSSHCHMPHRASSPRVYAE
jgi:NAD(P)-dependent dehydrogenase (short-subunit alcohol dehydrogenase family)